MIKLHLVNLLLAALLIFPYTYAEENGSISTITSSIQTNTSSTSTIPLPRIVSEETELNRRSKRSHQDNRYPQHKKHKHRHSTHRPLPQNTSRYYDLRIDETTVMPEMTEMPEKPKMPEDKPTPTPTIKPGRSHVVSVNVAIVASD